jgi:ribosomal-protein-alanine N-acetyltransferase
VELDTDRLRLRPPRLADAPALFRFMGDPQAMRFTHVLPDVRVCRRHIAAHERRRRRIGCAPWAVIEKQSGAIVGWGGLYNDPFDPGWGIEVAYLFAPSAWGRGYATELVGYCLDTAQTHLRLDTVAAFAHPDNAASRRVLEKTGFILERFVPGMRRYLYRRLL